MKKIYFILLAVLTLVVHSCRKDFEPVNTVPVVFQLAFPADYKEGAKPEKISVSLKNNITGEVQNLASDAAGKVAVSVLPGTYSLTASRSYTADESEALTGYAQESFVNASVAPLLISSTTAQVDVPLKGSRAGGLVIREYYYSGVPRAYFYDLFVELYNNSNETIYLDSLYLGNTKAASVAAYGFIQDNDFAHLAHVWMIPGSGKDHPLAPGASFVIASNAINHKSDPQGNSNSPVDLGAGFADFEAYWPYTNKTTDNPDVPNLVHAYASTTAGFAWLPGVFGNGLVIFKSPTFKDLPVSREPNTSGTTQFKAIPVSDIIDGVDCVMNANITSDKKRLPTAVDAGMVTTGGTYNGTSVRRKVKSVINGRTIFQDTNNSSQDFETNNTPSLKKWN